MQGNAEHNLRGYAQRSQMLRRKAWRIGVRIPRKRLSTSGTKTQAKEL